MSVATGLIACPQIQTDLNNMFIAGMPNRARVPQGLGEFVTSDLNSSGILQRQVSPGGSKRKKVEVVYSQQICESDVDDDTTRKCVSTNEDGTLSETYEIDPLDGVAIDRVFILSNLQEMCESIPTYFSGRILEMMDALDSALNKKIAYQAVLETGVFGLGTPNVDAARKILTISTKDENGKYDLTGYEQITEAAQFTGYGGIPYIFGFSEIQRYFKRMYAGCCGADGINISDYANQNGASFVADQFLWEAFKSVGNTEGFLMTRPGSLQLLTFNEYKGEFAQVNTEIYQQTTMVSPFSGREYDVTIKNECGNVSVQVRLAAKLVSLPIDMYPSCSNYAGVNYVNAGKITNPALA